MFHAGVHVPDCVTTAHTSYVGAAPAAYNRFQSFLTDGKPADTNNQPIFILQAQFVVHRYRVSKPSLASGPSIDWKWEVCMELGENVKLSPTKTMELFTIF